MPMTVLDLHTVLYMVSDWESGNAMLVTIYDDLTSTSTRAFRSYAGGGETTWTEYLHVNWKQNL